MKYPPARFWVSLIAIVSVVLCLSPDETQAQYAFVRKPIEYLTAPVDNSVSQLQARIDKGEARLDYDEQSGYLRSLLKHLKVPVSSQALVYSKTSFQASRISSQTPRAVYFGDGVYIGWVQGGDVVEISAVDPRLGAVFYTLKQRRSEKPTFQRRKHECLQCHATSRTERVPGHLVRSVFAQPDGQPLYGSGTYTTHHGSPLKHRWGGWYVTGTHGTQRHMGNLTFRDSDETRDPDLSKGANVTDLSGRLDTTPYLSGHSDIVALMVLEHQVTMHNLIAKAGIETRIALDDNAAMNKFFKRPPDFRSESTKSRIASVSDKLLKHLLFVGETQLTASIKGTASFAREFATRGPFDRKGRSLRQFDLKRRLFRFPCSYLIYSHAFERLPEPVKAHIYRRLWEVLNGTDKHADFAHLSTADRKAIREILQATKRTLPAYWKTNKRGAH